MTYNKIIFVLAFATALVLVANVSPINGRRYYIARNTSHNFTLGSRVKGDRLVLQKMINVPAKMFKVITHHATFIVKNYMNITQVTAYDQKSNGTGAFVTLEKGGIGKSNVTLQFKSQRGHGIHFLVSVYVI